MCSSTGCASHRQHAHVSRAGVRRRTRSRSRRICDGISAVWCANGSKTEAGQQEWASSPVRYPLLDPPPSPIARASAGCARSCRRAVRKLTVSGANRIDASRLPHTIIPYADVDWASLIERRLQRLAQRLHTDELDATDSTSAIAIKQDASGWQHTTSKSELRRLAHACSSACDRAHLAA